MPDLALRFDLLVLGLMSGLGYGLLATGLVLVYRATRVINLAHGQIGAFAAVVLLELVHTVGLPYPLALPLSFAAGAVVALAVERLVVRPLVGRSRLAVLVATIGVIQVLLVGQLLMPDIVGKGFPVPVEVQWEVASVVIRGEHLALVLLGPLALVGLTALVNRSRWGLAIRAVADNRPAARLAGIRADQVTTLVWVVAGALAAIAAILTIPLAGTGIGGTAATVMLGPTLLLRALAAGVAGRLDDIRTTVLAALGIGVVESVLFASYPGDPGLVDLLLFVGILVLLLLRSRDAAGADDEPGFGEDPRPLPEALRSHPRVRLARRLSVAALLGVALAAPLVLSTSSELFLLARVPVFAIVGVSVVILTGWAGQLSLGQMAFAGLGAMGTAALDARGVPFGAAVGYVTLAGAAVSLVIGLPALRLRGLLLTVTTLAFAVATGSYLLTMPIFDAGVGDVSVVTPGRVGPLNLDSYLVGYYACLAALLGVIAISRRLRASGIGRVLVAVDGNERAAAAMTVSPALAKLTAFAVAGGMATFAGGLLAGITRTFRAELFTPEQSLQVLTVVVVGGIGSIGGAVLGAVYLIGVPRLLGDSQTVQLATSGIGVLLVLRLSPGGLMGVVERLRDAAVARLVLDGPPVEPRADAAPDPDAGAAEDAVPRSAAQRLGAADGPAGARSATATVDGDVRPAAALETVGLRVRLGGRVIVNDVSLTVGAGEIVGLIGANGAGKSTLLDAVSGFLPAAGRILVHGEDVQELLPADRARLGLGRSFQSARLFPRLTVRECVQVALEARRRSEVVPSMLALPPAVRTEAWSRREADDLLDLLGLGDRADLRADQLSTGTRRVLELCCLLAQRPRVVLLDEPVAGVAQAEVEAFGPLLIELRRALGASMLVIEHDLPLVMGISDRMYCLESGAVIATGTPQEIRDDPRVIASYLGTDERAIARSGSAAPTGPRAGRRRRVLTAPAGGAR